MINSLLWFKNKNHAGGGQMDRKKAKLIIPRGYGIYPEGLSGLIIGAYLHSGALAINKLLLLIWMFFDR